MSSPITPISTLLDTQMALPISLNPAKASTMKDFIMPGADTLNYLDYFDEYTRKNLVVGTGVDINETPVKLFSLPTYIQKPWEMFHNVADVYDNALAVLYLTMRGSSLVASQLLSTLVYNMCIEGYNTSKPTPDERLIHYVGLRPRYAQDTGKRTTGKSPWYPFSRDNFYDTGNNMFVAIAMCRYVLKFALDASTHKLLARAVYDMWCFASVKGWCYKGPYHGFMGRPLRPDGKGMYLSIEHNIDAFSMLTLMELVLQGTSMDELGPIAEPGTTYDFNQIVPRTFTEKPGIDDIKTKLGYQKGEIRKLVESLFMSGAGDRQNAYAIGTGFCSDNNTINYSDPPPTDGITWNFLSGVDPDPNRKSKSLQWSVSNLVEDNVWQNRVFTGLIFSSEGTGIQWENSGSGLLAYLKFMYLRSTTADALASKYAVPPELSGMLKASCAIGRSVTNLINIQRAGGIPASFEGQGTIDTNNSGISWSYYAYPHTASTMWCAMAMRYLQSGYDETFNPYGVVSGTFITGAQDPNGAFAWANKLDFPVSCQLNYIPGVSAYPDAECRKPVPEGFACGDQTPEQCQDTYNLGLFCGFLNDETNPRKPRSNTAVHQALTRVSPLTGVPTGYCAAPGFTVCNDIGLMARGAAHLYTDINVSCHTTCGGKDQVTGKWGSQSCRILQCVTPAILNPLFGLIFTPLCFAGKI